MWKIVLRDKALMIYLLAGIIISMGFSRTEGMLPLHFDNEMKGIFGTNNLYPYLMALNGLLVVLFQFQFQNGSQINLLERRCYMVHVYLGLVYFLLGGYEVVWRI